MDTLGGLGAGDKFQFWAKLIDFGQQGGELLGLTWKGEDTLKDFNIFLENFAEAEIELITEICKLETSFKFWLK